MTHIFYLHKNDQTPLTLALVYLI